MEGKTAQAGGGFLPCQNSNISTEISSVQHRKAASALGWNVVSLAQKHGLENLGFLTLTFKDHVVSVKEAQRRLNSLITHIIKPRYQDYIGVLERQKSGRIHYHLLVVLGFDIRTGFNFAAIEARDYSSANPALRAEWAFWRNTAPAYRFGRTELMPIKSSEEAIGKYIGKYIGKHMETRQEADKGARLVRYSRGARVASTRFQFVSTGSQAWRSKLRSFAHYVAERTGCEPTMEGIREVCGPRWAYTHREFILSMPDVPGEAETVGLPPTPRAPSVATPSGHSPSEALIYRHCDRKSKSHPDQSKMQFDAKSGGPPSRSGSEPSDSADESAPEAIGNSYRNTSLSPSQRTGAVAPTSRPLLLIEPPEGGRRNTPIRPRDWITPFPDKQAFEDLRIKGLRTP